MNRNFFFAATILLPVFALVAMFAGCSQSADAPTAETQHAEATTPGTLSAAPAQPQIDALARSYLALRESLAQDRFEETPEQLAELRKAAQALADAGSPQVKSHSQAIAEHAAAAPQDIKQAREAFKTISAAAIELFKLAPPGEEIADSLYVAYCPMAEASWLQTSEQLANPYMGQKMLECGEVKETIKSSSA